MGVRDWLRTRRTGAAGVTELLQTADRLAAARGGRRAGDATIVLAAVDHSDGHASAALSDLTLDRDRVEAALAVAAAGVPGGHPGADLDEKSLLWRTSQLSREHLGGGRFSSALVLAAAATTQSGAVATLVERLGVDRTVLHDAAVARARQVAPPS